MQNYMTTLQKDFNYAIVLYECLNSTTHKCQMTPLVKFYTITQSDNILFFLSSQTI